MCIKLRRNPEVYWAGDERMVVLYNPSTAQVRRIRGSLARFWLSLHRGRLTSTVPSFTERLVEERWVLLDT